MFYYSATQKLVAGKTIQIFNYGDMRRDFTYIDDIVEGVVRVIDQAPEEQNPPAALFNIGNSSPVKLMDYIGAIETALGKKAIKEYLPMQPGDVYKTFADVSDLEAKFNYHPSTPVTEGVQRFVEWYTTTGMKFQGKS